MMVEILVVLGSPNSSKGKLSIMSKERLDFCLERFNNNMMILCTGGWGSHFNTTKEPHAYYTKNYLIKKGIPEDRFLENALSGNTVEDAVKTKEIISGKIQYEDLSTGEIVGTINVLKDASAIALYGAKAANGVVMITTKSGSDSEGKMQITYDGTFGVSNVGFLPVEQKTFGQGWSGDRALPENGNWGAIYDGKNRVWGNVVDNSQLIKPYNYVENRIRDVFEYGYSFKNFLFSLLNLNKKYSLI